MNIFVMPCNALRWYIVIIFISNLVLNNRKWMRLKFMTVFFCLKIVDLTILFCLFFPKVICDNNYAFKYIHTLCVRNGWSFVIHFHESCFTIFYYNFECSCILVHVLAQEVWYYFNRYHMWSRNIVYFLPKLVHCWTVHSV